MEEWIEDAQQHIKLLSSEEEKVQFLLDHLTGTAKLRIRDPSSKKSANAIFEALKHLFQDTDSVAQLQQAFYQRDQKPGETLQDYSLQLMKLADRLCKRGVGVIGNRDLVFRERFIDGITDHHLRREMKRYALEHESASSYLPSGTCQS